MSPTEAAAIIERWSGRSGDSESETTLTFSNGARSRVSFYSGRGTDICALLKRVGSHCTVEWETADGIALLVDADCYRGPAMAFSRVDSKGPAMSDEQKAALREARP